MTESASAVTYNHVCCHVVGSVGETVPGVEVEEIIYTRMEVQECAVVGLPDREWGERVTAFIIPKPGCVIVPDEMRSFLKSSLSSYKVPKEVVIVDEMPKSPAGKILKRDLKKRYLEENP